MNNIMSIDPNKDPSEAAKSAYEAMQFRKPTRRERRKYMAKNKHAILKNWAAVVSDNIRLGKKRHMQFLKECDVDLKHYNDDKAHSVMTHLTEFYGDKIKAAEVMNENLRLKAIIFDKKVMM
jgi:hypothetical protein